MPAVRGLQMKPEVAMHEVNTYDSLIAKHGIGLYNGSKSNSYRAM